MNTTFEDVLAFIATASSSDLSNIADEIQENGYEFECLECETHECEEPHCDHNEDLKDIRDDFIRDLVRRGNQFGLDDMLQEFKREAHQIGAYLNERGVA